MFAEGQIQKIVAESIEVELRDGAVAALMFETPPCEHQLASIRNKYVQSGLVCIRCGSLFAEAPTAVPPPEEPVEYYETGVAGTRWPKGWAAAWRRQANGRT